MYYVWILQIDLLGVGSASNWTENRGSLVSGNRTPWTCTMNTGSCSWATREGIGFRLHSRRLAGFHGAGRRRTNRSRTTAGHRRRSWWSPDTTDFGYHSGNHVRAVVEARTGMRYSALAPPKRKHSCRSKTTYDSRQTRQQLVNYYFADFLFLRQNENGSPDDATDSMRARVHRLNCRGERHERNRTRWSSDLSYAARDRSGANRIGVGCTVWHRLRSGRGLHRKRQRG